MPLRFIFKAEQGLSSPFPPRHGDPVAHEALCRLIKHLFGVVVIGPFQLNLHKVYWV